MKAPCELLVAVTNSGASQVITFRPRQHGCHFADDIFKCNFLYRNCPILIDMSLKFVPKVTLNGNPVLV